jgi:hypothetical protein
LAKRSCAKESLEPLTIASIPDLLAFVREKSPVLIKIRHEGAVPMQVFDEFGFGDIYLAKIDHPSR